MAVANFPNVPDMLLGKLFSFRKGLAAAVLASLPFQMGLEDGAVVQSTVYAEVLFSIVLCAMLVFAAERGMLNPFAAMWLGKYAMTPVEAGKRPSGALLIDPALAPADLLADLSGAQPDPGARGRRQTGGRNAWQPGPEGAG